MQNNQDGTIDPHGLCTALSRYATRSGAKVFQIAKGPFENLELKNIEIYDKQKDIEIIGD